MHQYRKLFLTMKKQFLIIINKQQGRCAKPGLLSIASGTGIRAPIQAHGGVE